MKTILGAVLSLPIAVAVSTSLFAQWDPWPTPGIPRLPDGEPDLEAPTPRIADGKPDLSGIWEVVTHNQRGVQGRPVGEPEEPPPGAPPYATFWELEHGFKDGLPLRPWRKAAMNPASKLVKSGKGSARGHSRPTTWAQAAPKAS